MNLHWNSRLPYKAECRWRTWTSAAHGTSRSRNFSGFHNCKGDDFDDLFAPSLQKLGRLQYDEMYGFVPALALGGPADLAHLQKLKAVEHLALLAQLSELRILRGPE